MKPIYCIKLSLNLFFLLSLLGVVAKGAPIAGTPSSGAAPHIPDKSYPSRCLYEVNKKTKATNCTDYDYTYFENKCLHHQPTEKPPANISNACRYITTAPYHGWNIGTLSCTKSPAKVIFETTELCTDLEVLTIDPDQVFIGPRERNRYDQSAPEKEVVAVFDSNGNYKSVTAISPLSASNTLAPSGVPSNCYRKDDNGIPTNGDFCQTIDPNDVGYCELKDCGNIGNKKCGSTFFGKWWVRYYNKNQATMRICRGGIDYYNVQSGNSNQVGLFGNITKKAVPGTFSWGADHDHQVSACIYTNDTRAACNNQTDLTYSSPLYSNCDKAGGLPTAMTGRCDDLTIPSPNSPITNINQYRAQYNGIKPGDCVRFFHDKTGPNKNLTVSNPKWYRLGGDGHWHTCAYIELSKLVPVIPSNTNPSPNPGANDVPIPITADETIPPRPLASNFDISDENKLFSIWNSGIKILSLETDPAVPNATLYTAKLPATSEFQTKDLKISSVGNQTQFTPMVGSAATTFNFTNSVIIGGANGQAADVTLPFGNLTMTSGHLTLSNGNLKLAAGAIDVAGTIHSTGIISSDSDARFKKDFKELSHPLTKILNLKGLNYKFRTDEFEERNFSHNLQSGLIAQTTEKQIPEIVEKDKDGYSSINYNGVIPYLIEAIKELHHTFMAASQDNDATLKLMTARLDQLENENADLKTRIQKLEAKN